MTRSHADKVPVVLALATVVATLGLTVDPWPQDRWYDTQDFLVGHFPGQDDYSPIAAPALLYRAAHLIAVPMGLHLAGEFYVAVVLQNLLALLGACFLYYTLRTIGLDRLAGPIAIGVLLFVLSTGLPQCFYSENATLFLTSAAILAFVRLLGWRDTPARFWRLAVASGVAVGLLVATRMVPVLLIPGMALLLWHRLPPRRVAQLVGTLTSITVLMLASMVVANHARFDRYELTNSLGRHLWQGVKDFSDRALARSSEYRMLRRVDPHIQGQNWWQIPPDPSTNIEDWREPVLRRLSIKAIESAPALYAARGAMKFARTIGAAPFRVGFGTVGGGPNPLDRQQPLPPLATLVKPPAAWIAAGIAAGVAVVDAAFRWIYGACRWLYPITIVGIALYGLALLAERLRRRLGHRIQALFLVVGVPIAAIPVASGGLEPGPLLGGAASLLLVAACAVALHRALSRAPLEVRGPLEAGRPHEAGRLHDAGRPLEAGGLREAGPPSGTDTALFAFLAAIFFGSLWLSWQIEYPDSRDALPYLPLWAVMLALALDFWMRLAAAHSRLHPPVRGRRPGALSAAARATASEAADAPSSSPSELFEAACALGRASSPAPCRGWPPRSS